MSLMQRNKGKAYERAIATWMRSAFPGTEWRRSSQADRAVQSDIYAVGNPTLERIWWELQDARNPTPHLKLRQAERDVAERAVGRLPVVVWHRIREHESQATCRLATLAYLGLDDYVLRDGAGDQVVTMSLCDLAFLLGAKAVPL